MDSIHDLHILDRQRSFALLVLHGQGSMLEPSRRKNARRKNPSGKAHGTCQSLILTVGCFLIRNQLRLLSYLSEPMLALAPSTSL
jgi:hypothetical protein